MVENNHEELDLRYYFRLLFANWIAFIFFGFGSILFSSFMLKYYFEPKLFTAEVVFEQRFKEDAGYNLNRLVGPAALASLVPSMPNSASSKLVAKILGKEFLAKLIEDLDLQKKLRTDPTCAGARPDNSIVYRSLHYFNIYQLPPRTSDQINGALIECLKMMIDVETYSHNQIVTNAYVVRVKNSDPHFSAYLANEIANKFFQSELDEGRRNYEKTMKYLSDSIGSARVEIATIREKMDKFLIDNVSEFSSNSGFGQNIMGRLPEKTNSIRSQSFQDVSKFFALKKLETQNIDLLKSRSNLEELRTSDLILLYRFDKGEDADIYSTLSGQFLADHQKVLASKLNSERKRKEIISLISKELIRIDELIAITSGLIAAKEAKADEQFNIQEKYNELNYEYAKRIAYADALDLTLKEKGLEYGVKALQEGYLHSSASVPLVPSDPNFLIVYVAFGFISILCATLYIILRQNMAQYIYQGSQIPESFGFKSFLSLSKNKHLGFNAIDKGEVKCFDEINSKVAKYMDPNIVIGLIEIKSKDPKFRSLNLAERVSLVFGNFASARNLKTACFIKDNFKIFANKSIFSGDTKLTVNSSLKYTTYGNKVSCFGYPQKLSDISILDMELDKQKKDKVVFLASSEEENSRLRFDLINRCDYYFLIGRYARIKMDAIPALIPQGKDEEKCLGIILVK